MADCTAEIEGYINEICVDTTAGAGSGIWRCPSPGDCSGTTAWERVDDTTGGTGHTDGANCVAGEIPLGVSDAGVSQDCYEPATGDITGVHAGTDLTADLEEEIHCSEHNGTGVDCTGDAIILLTNEISALSNADIDPAADGAFLVDTSGDGVNVTSDVFVFQMGGEDFYLFPIREYPTVDGQVPTYIDADKDIGWATPGGSGDVTAVGDCLTSACFTPGSPDAALTFDNATSGTVTLQTVAGALGTEVVSLPAETGTLLTTISTIPATVDLAANVVDAIGELDATIRSGDDVTVVTGTAGADGICAEWNTDGDLVAAVSAAACGSGGATTDGGDVTRLTSVTDDFAIGGTDSSAAYFFDEATGAMSINVAGASIDIQQSATLGQALILKEGADEAGGTDEWNLKVDDTGGLTSGGADTGGGYASLICTLHLSGRIPDACVGDGSDAGGTPLTQEQVEDFAGDLIENGTGTHTGIAITYQDGDGDVDFVVDHDAATNFVADEHVAHAGVTMTAGSGMTGGGTIAATRTLDVIGGDGIIANANDMAIDLNATLDGVGSVSSLSGMEFTATSELALLQGCSDGQGVAWEDTGATWDCNTFAGAGDMLQATYDVDTDNIVDSSEAVYINCNNDSGVQIDQTQPVYISGFDVPSDLPECDLADADAGAMPAVGLNTADCANGADCTIITSGILEGIQTNHSGWAVGDGLFVSDDPSTEDGLLDDAGPLGATDATQKIAEVGRVHATLGELVIFGAGRSNAVPNLADANFWVGNGTNVAIAVSMGGVMTMDNTGAVTITGNDALDPDFVVGDDTDDNLLDVSVGGTGVATLAVGGIVTGNDAGDVVVLAAGATTTILVGGGAGTIPVWTTVTGTGAPVKGTSPTFTTSVLFGAAGVSVTDDADGAITFLGLGDGEDEDLTLNFDDVADTVGVSSSTGVTTLDMGSIGVISTGTISGTTKIVTSTGGALAVNTVTIATASADYDLPDDCDSATGAWVMVVVRDISEVVSLTVSDSSDTIVYKGISPVLDANDELDSPGAAQDSVAVVCLEADTWYVTANSGDWEDGGAP